MAPSIAFGRRWGLDWDWPAWFGSRQSYSQLEMELSTAVDVLFKGRLPGRCDSANVTGYIL